MDASDLPWAAVAGDDELGGDGSEREGRKMPGARRLGEWPAVPYGEGGYRAEASEVEPDGEGGRSGGGDSGDGGRTVGWGRGGICLGGEWPREWIW